MAMVTRGGGALPVFSVTHAGPNARHVLDGGGVLLIYWSRVWDLKMQSHLIRVGNLYSARSQDVIQCFSLGSKPSVQFLLKTITPPQTQNSVASLA
jgi:hypothetical protein